LMLVIDNLLRNAALYTEQGFVRVTFGGGCLTIEDTGPGIDAAELPRVIQRHNRGGRPITDDGLGLGLAIVKRICERFDWRLDIASTPGCGTRASLGFPLPTSQNFHAVLTGS
ncbi:MAG TPA: sensor histidine kinase, partial [Burkholderiales bacterium]|nr:sensor histidine kinase [Burkholderiales bacterium]